MDWDDAYSNHTHIPDADSYPPRWAAKAQALRDMLSIEGRAELGVSYGDTTRQAYDLFLPEADTKELVVFVHGGYWRRFGCEDWSHLAQGALDRGCAVAMPSYDLCPTVHVADITRQISVAIKAIAERIPAIPIRLMGHSAGGHLVSRMMAPSMLPDAVMARIRIVMPISPVSDLRPLLLTQMNADFRLSEKEAHDESPIFQATPDIPVTVWVGADERPVFLDQARWLAKAWGAAHIIDSGKHHFDVVDGLEQADSPITEALFSD